MIIDTKRALEEFVGRAQHSSVLAFDTEFLRDRSYYAKLCLLQLATDDEIVLLDPLEIGDISALKSLFTNQNIMKVVHAGSQDIEILYRLLGCVPSPIFDTQIAATLLGQTQQVGYAVLVHNVCGVHLKKTDSFTDWSRRPLSDSQQQYAADDVAYLPKLYSIMKEELEAKGRLSWLDEDFKRLIDPERFIIDPRTRYRHLRRVSQLNPQQLSAAREVAAWRELQAQTKNIPRKWIIADEQIVEACKRGARSIDELYMIRGLESGLGCADARAIVKCIICGLDAPESSWPQHPKSTKNEVNVDVEVDLFSSLVRLRAKENNIAYQTLASRDDLVALARFYDDEVELLKGWRREIVGEELLALRDGKFALGIHKGKLQVIEQSPAD